MRTYPALALFMIAPLQALAQTQQGSDPLDLNRMVTTSPAFWYWVVSFAIAFVAFILSTVVISRPGWHRTRQQPS